MGLSASAEEGRHGGLPLQKTLFSLRVSASLRAPVLALAEGRLSAFIGGFSCSVFSMSSVAECPLPFRGGDPSAAPQDDRVSAAEELLRIRIIPCPTKSYDGQASPDKNVTATGDFT